MTVKVERLAPEGEAIARQDGASRIVFVPHGVPGDRLEVELVSTKSTFSKARLKKLIEAGPERILPPCPLHFDPSRPSPACGGCDWQQLHYQAQLKHKREIVRDCLVRIAKLKDVPLGETIASPQQWSYRNKVQIPFGPGRHGSGKPIAGFYASGSHDIVDFEACPVQPELSMRVVRKIKDFAAKWNWPIYEEGRRRGWLRHLYLRTNGAGEALAALVTHSRDFPREREFVQEINAEFPEVIGLYQNIQPLDTSVVLGPHWRRIWGARGIEEKIGRLTFLSSPGAFLQVNTPAAELLYDAALAALTEGGRKFDLCLDLYCGVGTLSLWVAPAFTRVIGVEENKDAIRDAYKNAERNGVKNVRFTAGRSEAVLPRLAKTDLHKPCAAIVDPPRTGCSNAVLRAITLPPFKRIVYVSCDPATFARDAAFLCRSGFQLKRVQPLDLFPQTSHVELVGLFDRP